MAASRFEENLDNAVNHFKLLRVALGEERINALADISWVFFPFQEQESARRQGKTFGQATIVISSGLVTQFVDGRHSGSWPEARLSGVITTMVSRRQ
jgi:hypothetical protein